MHTGIAKILIVDDSDAVRSIVRGILSQAGYVVLEASDLNSAIEVFLDQKPDGVLLDIAMPGATGMDVLRELRAIDPAVRVAMLTGERTPHTVAEAVQLRVRDYVAKPFTAQRLRDAVQRILA